MSPGLQALSAHIQEALSRLPDPYGALSLVSCLPKFSRHGRQFLGYGPPLFPAYLILTLCCLQSTFPCVISFAAHRLPGQRDRVGPSVGPSLGFWSLERTQGIIKTLFPVCLCQQIVSSLGATTEFNLVVSGFSSGAWHTEALKIVY